MTLVIRSPVSEWLYLQKPPSTKKNWFMLMAGLNFEIIIAFEPAMQQQFWLMFCFLKMGPGNIKQQELLLESHGKCLRQRNVTTNLEFFHATGEKNCLESNQCLIVFSSKEKKGREGGSNGILFCHKNVCHKIYPKIPEGYNGKQHFIMMELNERSVNIH